jgi:hypothetical protein
MKTVICEPLEQSDASWYCCNCGLPNFNTSLFEDFEIHTYSLSSNLNETSTSINDSIQSTTNIGPPQCTSSPTKQKKYPVNKKSLRLLNINFQSMKAKREEFWNMLIGPGFGWQSEAFYYMWIKKQIWLKYGFRDLLQLIIQIVDKSIQTLSIFPIYFIEKNNFSKNYPEVNVGLIFKSNRQKLNMMIEFVVLVDNKTDIGFDFHHII